MIVLCEKKQTKVSDKRDMKPVLLFKSLGSVSFFFLLAAESSALE